MRSTSLFLLGDTPLPLIVQCISNVSKIERDKIAVYGDVVENLPILDNISMSILYNKRMRGLPVNVDVFWKNEGAIGLSKNSFFIALAKCIGCDVFYLVEDYYGLLFSKTGSIDRKECEIVHDENGEALFLL